jgi:methyl halide transferase
MSNLVIVYLRPFSLLDHLLCERLDRRRPMKLSCSRIHVFDEPDERQQFAAQVAAVLAPDGLWLSLIGSTEGPAREVGPPRRSEREVTLAIEPALEIVELRSAEFHGNNAKAWFCLSRKRTMPAQPSTLHD